MMFFADTYIGFKIYQFFLVSILKKSKNDKIQDKTHAKNNVVRSYVLFDVFFLYK